MDDLISRQAAIDEMLRLTNCRTLRELNDYTMFHKLTEMWSGGILDAIDTVIGLPSAQLTLYGYKIEHLVFIAKLLEEEQILPHDLREQLNDIGRMVKVVLDKQVETIRAALGIGGQDEVD